MPLPRIRQNYSFRKSVGFDFTPGKHYVRFVQPFESAVVIEIHWINSAKVMVQCLKEDCPICRNNRLIWAEYPGTRGEELRKLGYIPKGGYAYLNILDRTEVKVCKNTECQAEINKDFTDCYPTTCPHCNTLLVEVTPIISNKVKVIRLNQTLVDLINAKEASKRNQAGNPIPSDSYDWELLVLPGDKKETAPDALLDRNDPVKVPADSLYDLSTQVMKLTPEEILEVLKGVKVRDIFAVRKASTEPHEGVIVTELTEEQKKSQAEKIAELYAE